MKLKTIKNIKALGGKKVLLRVDFNVSIGDDMKVDSNEDYRLVKSLPTIKYLIKKGAKVIIMAHLGRPKGKIIENLRLDPIAIRLSQLLKKCIYKSDTILDVTEIEDMKNGDVMLLENIRFDAREERGSKEFAKHLAKMGDVYVNDAFGASHRNHVSVATLQEYLPSYGGLLLADEIKHLSEVIDNPKKPLVTIIGGAKISTKIKVIKRFLPISRNVLLGGALANTVLRVMGVSVGKSMVEPKMFKEVKKINLTDNKLIVPVDGMMAKSRTSKSGRLDALADVKNNEHILDIGPDSVKLYESILKTAKTIVWNGPLGMIETPAFAKGTEDLIKILVKVKARTIVGGGETVQMIRTMGMVDKFDFVSTGGGAMLEFLEGKELPGLKNIKHKT